MAKLGIAHRLARHCRLQGKSGGCGGGRAGCLLAGGMAVGRGRRKGVEEAGM